MWYDIEKTETQTDVLTRLVTVMLVGTMQDEQEFRIIARKETKQKTDSFYLFPSIKFNFLLLGETNPIFPHLTVLIH